MKYSGINHIALVTRDMDMTIRFWRDLLGMRLIAGIGGNNSRQYFFEIAPGCLVSFFEWPGVEPVPDRDPGTPVKGPFIFDHLCMEVGCLDELWSLKERLEAADVWTSELLDNGFIYSVFSTDPNNIQLEFCCPVEGVDISRDARIADPRVSGAAQEGAGPQPGIWPDVAKPAPPEERKIYPGSLKEIVKHE
jgi:catechol 2,3-dioxygenase-like lactoylglutathione lyase family enzyme